MRALVVVLVFSSPALACAIAPAHYPAYGLRSPLAARLLQQPGYPDDPAATQDKGGVRPGVRGSGPVLVLTDPANDFTGALCDEMLPAEGIPECAQVDTAALTPAVTFNPYQVIIATDRAPVTAAQASRLTSWVRQGGHLIAMRPAPTLRALLGLGRPAGQLQSAYLAIDTSAAPGAGLTAATIQYHGPADQVGLDGARAVAQLYSTGSARTAFPAVTSRALGAGTADAYTFDPVHSVFLSRNGNPALTGKHTVSTDGYNRIMDRFGAGFLDGAKAGIPQADELMHLLTNQIETTAALPRLWYLPSHPAKPGGFLPAAVILTGDDHAVDSQTLARFRWLKAQSPGGCSVADWTCLTATSYAVTGAFADQEAKPYTDQGFEVSPHLTRGPGCTVEEVSQSGTEARVQRELAEWAASYPAIAAAHPPVTERWHCYGIWNTYAGLADADASAGITADLDTACWPQEAFSYARCFITGTALPLSYADENGRLTGVSQFTTQATDENPATRSVAALHQLLAPAVGSQEYYGYYAVQAHLDNRPESNALERATVATAHQFGLPVISAEQAATFWAERRLTRISGLRSSSSALSFTLSGSARNLELMIPFDSGGRSVVSMARDGTALAKPVVRTVNGVEYALVPVATAGGYVITYR